MKKILTIITLIFVFVSCDKLEDLNKNTKDFTEVPGAAVFNGATRAFANQMLTCNVNSNNTMLFAQHWTETTYPDESRYDMVTRPIPANHMNAIYRTVLMNLKDAKTLLTNRPAILDAISQTQRDNQLAVVEVLSVWAWSNIVETYGGMPYTEAFDLLLYPTPKYDDGLTIYKDLIVRLNAAIATLTAGTAYPSMGAYDQLCVGTTSAQTVKWLKVANSLKLRMGLMLSDIPAEAALAKTTIEAAAPGAFSVAITSPTTGDKVTQTYLSASPNTNPLYTELVASGRSDFVVANTLVKAMNALSDPRRALYYNTVKDTAIADGGRYLGGIYGSNNGYNNFSHIRHTLVTTTLEGLLMDYVEVEFLKAEAVARGYTVAGTAKSHYDAAITASILYWGGTAAQAATYLAQPSVDYATVVAASNWKKAIGEQAWIAYWFRGFTAWTSWRRLDYPRLIAPSNHVLDVNGIPLRYTYAVSEQTLNGSNYTTAVTALGTGGDNAMTPLFWDVNHYNTLTGL